MGGVEFEDTFEDPVLAAERWLPYYLPHWSSRERAAARYRIADGLLRYEFPEPPPGGRYPKEFVVDYVRAVRAPAPRPR